jgi:hypothetical protein
MLPPGLFFNAIPRKALRGAGLPVLKMVRPSASDPLKPTLPPSRSRPTDDAMIVFHDLASRY